MIYDIAVGEVPVLLAVMSWQLCADIEDYYVDAVLSTLVRGEARAGEYGLV